MHSQPDSDVKCAVRLWRCEYKAHKAQSRKFCGLSLPAPHIEPTGANAVVFASKHFDASYGTQELKVRSGTGRSGRKGASVFLVAHPCPCRLRGNIDSRRCFLSASTCWV